MLAAIWEFLCFWGRCLKDGATWGFSAFGIIETVAGITWGILKFREKKLPEERVKEWEDRVSKVASLVFVGSFLMSTLFVAPFLQYSDEHTQRTNAVAQFKTYKSATNAEGKTVRRRILTDGAIAYMTTNLLLCPHPKHPEPPARTMHNLQVAIFVLSGDDDTVRLGRNLASVCTSGGYEPNIIMEIPNPDEEGVSFNYPMSLNCTNFHSFLRRFFSEMEQRPDATLNTNSTEHTPLIIRVGRNSQ